MCITSMNKCLLRTLLEGGAFSRHIRQTLGVTEPRNTGQSTRLLTVICKPRAALRLLALHAVLPCIAGPRGAATARQERTNRNAWSRERCPVTPCFPAL